MAENLANAEKNLETSTTRANAKMVKEVALTLH
jgi:hypothetical protein